MQTNTSMKNLDDMTAEVIGLGRQAADRALACQRRSKIRPLWRSKSRKRSQEGTVGSA